ncbi:hypothetical protein E2C01_047514 [Portunus trituberculatus]|uniref:Uncharacterized protein n=1 Tax=Portunus trituberculatus TaxID=210409 RepID=A0A5B7G8S1_PORTR|nr:hypothetical protein [Portunus trituberculatus]
MGTTINKNACATNRPKLSSASLIHFAVVQWNHACFGVRGVSKDTGSNPVHGPSVGWASSLAATVSWRLGFEIGGTPKKYPL